MPQKPLSDTRKNGIQHKSDSPADRKFGKTWPFNKNVGDSQDPHHHNHDGRPQHTSPASVRSAEAGTDNDKTTTGTRDQRTLGDPHCRIGRR